MRLIKDVVVCVPIVFLLMVATFMFDDSYEDSKLSAQVLDEAISQSMHDHVTKYDSVVVASVND